MFTVKEFYSKNEVMWRRCINCSEPTSMHILSIYG